MNKILSPQEIQSFSFKIVRKKFGPYLETKSEEERAVITRIAHAAADTEYAKSFIFHPESCKAGIEALKAGKNIITDVEMVRVGIRSRDLALSGSNIVCLLNDEDVIESARKKNLTRASVSMRKAGPLMQGAVVAIGNAPTALFEICELIRSGKIKPALVVGVPIGFVGAAESKEELEKVGSVPFITNRGIRGGSAIAASIVNALIALAFKGSSPLGRSAGLKRGYTTGTCAQAAAKGAAIMLCSGKTVECVEVELPGGNSLTLPVTEQEIGRDFARCGVVKDSGDDPDVTNGVTVFCELSYSKRRGITISGGQGVGTITKPGLAVAVGESAINPVPRRMIEKELSAYIPKTGGLKVLITIPGGEKLAKKTWNPRLGIKGGISIIGTTGIVEPKSTSAYKMSIELNIKVAAASGSKTLFLTPGYVGERSLRERFKVPEEAIVKIGDHVGFSLNHCVSIGVKRVVLIGHIGKLVKLAAGIFNTHSKSGDARLETIAAYAAACGAGSSVVKQILNLELAEAALPILKEHKLLETFNLIAARVVMRCSELTKKRLAIGVVILSLNGEILACEPDRLIEREEWERFTL